MEILELTMKNFYQLLMIPVCSILLVACGNDTAQVTEQTPITTPPVTAPQTIGRMLQPNALIHIVADISPSIVFYRDGVGFDLVSGPVALENSALLNHLQNDYPDASGQVATFNIPGSEMDFQLISFSGVEGNTFSQRLYDPGVTRFSISVRDIDAAFAAVNEYDIIVDTTGGGPVYTQRPRNDTQAVMMRDPDGFVFEFVQSGNPIVTDVPESSNIYNARSSLALEERERSMEFYGDILGYEAAGPNTVIDAVLLLEGTPEAVATSGRTQPPGSTNVWFFWEFSNIARTKREPNVQDPGASVISLKVEGLSDLVNKIDEAGFSIVTAGRQALSLNNNRLGILVRSPDGLLVELIEDL